MSNYLHGAKDVALTKEEVEYILEHIHRAVEVIQKNDWPEENILINHLNSIGAKLVNR